MTGLWDKALNKLAVQSGSLRVTTSLSDHQAYRQVCIDATNDYRAFMDFRRNRIYNLILEHVTQEQGQAYLDVLRSDPSILSALEEFKRNDEYGNPRTFPYPGIGTISPTTLRYVKVLADLKSHFQSLDGLSICEIGVGYGGQCRIINAYYKPAQYCLVDIQPALGLAERYLDNYVIDSVLTYRTMNELAESKYDLVISNYAFTELSRDLQDVYLDKVILRSRRGYITYNETTPVDFHSYKSDELIKMIPKSRIIEERPLTHKNNCIILWGEKAGKKPARSRKARRGR